MSGRGSHCRQTQSAPLRRARDDHVRDSSHRLRHSAELATSCSPWNPPWEVPQETCVAPSSPRSLICQVLLAQNLVPLQSLPGGVQKKALRIHSALDIMQSLQNELVTVVHDENSEDVQLDVVAHLLGLKHIGGCATCHEQQSVELKLAFHTEILHGRVVLPITRHRFVERCVPFVCHAGDGDDDANGVK